MPARNDAEFRLQCAVVQHLALAAAPGVLYFHPANGEARSKRTAGRLKAMGVVAGIPDMVVIVDGRAHGLELKAMGGRQSPAQRLIEQAWTAAGGVYRVATGWDEAQAVLREWGALRASYHHEPARRRQMPLPLEAA